jgi:branched-chain amino acid transport system substrate-binding protein
MFLFFSNGFGIAGSIVVSVAVTLLLLYACSVLKSGGKVLGKVRHPFPGTDLSSFLLQAQASGAKIIGLANAGGNTINSIKQASEFGIVQGGQKLAAS